MPGSARSAGTRKLSIKKIHFIPLILLMKFSIHHYSGLLFFRVFRVFRCFRIFFKAWRVFSPVGKRFQRVQIPVCRSSPEAPFFWLDKKVFADVDI